MEFQSTLPVRGATLAKIAVITGARISIHAPRAGSDTSADGVIRPSCTFQSTLPVRGATQLSRSTEEITEDFNPRSPCGERRLCQQTCRWPILISIHAPRAGSDVDATGDSESHEISIHAPRAGSDRHVPAEYFGA